MKIKFTDTFIKSLRTTGKPYSHGDTEHRGLMVRVSATGTKTFALAYHSKVGQKTRFLTFGRYGDMTLADAFAAHAKARAALANGDDPQAAKVEAREAVKNAVPFREVRERFAGAVIAGQRSAHQRTLMLERTGRRFGWDDKPIGSITDDDAIARLERLRDGKSFDPETGKTGGGPTAAWSVLSILRELWKWAKRNKLVTVNVFADLEVTGVHKPKRRTRTLTPAEIRLVWSALDRPEAYGMSHDAATAIRLIFATAARPGMVSGMMTGELHDLDGPQPAAGLRVVGGFDHDDEDDHDGPVWILPHERMKRDDEKYPHKEPFIVPLNALAVRLVRGAGGGRDGRAFGAAYPRGTAQLNVIKLDGCVRKLVKALKMQRWTPHDARRTAASMLSAMKLPNRPRFRDEEIGWLMAHRGKDSAVSSTTGIYTAGNERFDEKRFMATMLGDELERCIRDERIGLGRARYKRAA